MRRDRYFYSATSFVMVLLLLAGFRRFFLEGKEAGGNAIPQPILALVIVHGTALTAWILLFFVQSVLIASRNRKVHMKLGWFAATVALVIAISGPLVAVAGARLDPGYHIFGMTYRQFILPMLSEIAAFTIFVVLGLSFRKRPDIHRSMMLLATLSIISGATARISFLRPFLGHTGWVELFGPAFALGALLAIIRTISTRSFDRWFVAGYAGLAFTYIMAMNLALGETWSRIAERIAPG